MRARRARKLRGVSAFSIRYTAYSCSTYCSYSSRRDWQRVTSLRSSWRANGVPRTPRVDAAWNTIRSPSSVRPSSSATASAAGVARARISSAPLALARYLVFKGSVTGGYVYRGQKIPGLWGRYLFADFVRADFYALTAGPDGAACDVVENAINNTVKPAISTTLGLI